MTEQLHPPERTTSKAINGVAVAANVLNNRSSDTNLLDSCVDDDDDDDDNVSLEACGSNEEIVATYVDATGRQRQQPNDVPSPKKSAALVSVKNVGVKAANANGVTLRNTTPVPPLSTTAAVTPDSMTYHTPPPTTAQPRRNVSVSPPGMDGLEFDLNEPWERSLLRQLEQPKESASASPPPLNRYKLLHDAVVVPTTKPMVLLGHTESRDYAMEYDVDDNISLETNNSSCPPAGGRKMQLIHRSPFALPQPRIVYHIPSSNDDDHHLHNNYPTANYYYHQPSDPIAQQQQHAHSYNQLPIIIGRNSGSNHPTAASSLTNVTDDGRDDEMIQQMMMADTMSYRKIPTHLPHSGNTTTTATKQQQQQQHYLEMEASMGGASYNGEMDYNEQQQPQHYLDHPNTDHIQPDPGCFCLGYNMLDYIISAAPSQKQLQRPAINGKKQRHGVGVLRPVRLPRVSETVLMMSNADDDNSNTNRNMDNVMSEVIDTSAEVLSSTKVSKSSLSTKRMIKKSRSVVEPEGTYVPQTEHHQLYFSTAPSATEYNSRSNDTRRQGVDL